MNNKINKIKRNDPCPCGSNKKYKKCCYLDDPGKGTINVRSWREQFVLCKLLDPSNNSNTFRRFYKENRGIIKPSIFWINNSNLEISRQLKNGYLACSHFKEDKEYCCIVLRQIPALLEDDYIIAHELGHFILDSEGFPTIGCIDTPNNKIRTLSTCLCSMIQDPIIDRRLISYGFDMYKGHEREIKQLFKGIKKEPPPDEPLHRLFWAAIYVDQILNWSIFDSVDKTPLIEFTSWFENKYSDIAKEGQDLLELIQSIGYDTPNKMNDLNEKIITTYNLGEHLNSITYYFKM